MTAEFVLEMLRYTDVGIFAYFVALNSSYLVLIVMAGLEFARHLRRAPFAGADHAREALALAAITAGSPDPAAAPTQSLAVTA